MTHEMCIEIVLTYPCMLEVDADELITQEMFDKVVKKPNFQVIFSNAIRHAKYRKKTSMQQTM